MATEGGPKIVRDGLIIKLDAANRKGTTPAANEEFNDSGAGIRGLRNRNRTPSMKNGVKIGNLNYYTAFGIQYPEGNYGGSAASRDGITPGFNVTSGTKTYDCSRDLNMFVFNDDTNSWVPDSYFNGERVSGHCYDTYDGQPSQHATFQSDYDNIKATFPNATFIIIGSHAAENNDNDSGTLSRLQELGFPDSQIGVGRPEYILVAKPGKNYIYAYENYSVNPGQVAHAVFPLPIDKNNKDNYFEFDGSNDYIDFGSDITISPANQGWTAIYVFNTDSASTLQHFNSAEADDFNANWLAILSSKLAVWDHGQGVWKYGNTQFSDGTWYHVAFVQESGTSMQYYVNGVAEGGDHTSFTFSSGYSALKTRYVGRYEYNGGYSRYFNGKISIVQMYDRALTANEVLQNYNGIKGRFGL